MAGPTIIEGTVVLELRISKNSDNLVLRSDKNIALTSNEVDNNFVTLSNLNPIYQTVHLIFNNGVGGYVYEIDIDIEQDITDILITNILRDFMLTPNQDFINSINIDSYEIITVSNLKKLHIVFNYNV